MLKKIRHAMAKDSEDMGALGGVVEMDEFWIIGNRWRHGWSKKQVTRKPVKTPVISIVQKSNREFAGRARIVVPELDHKGRLLAVANIRKAILGNVSMLAEVHTDEAPHYNEVRAMGFEHGTVKHEDQWVDHLGHVRSNNCESFHALPKRMHWGTSRKFSKKYLRGYMEEAAWRWSNRREKPTLDGLVRLAEKRPAPDGKAPRAPEPWPPPMDEETQMELF